MLKVLLKKQFTEVFKGYFYDAKKNQMRSKKAIILWFLFFVVILVGFLGGTFASVAMSLCGTMTSAGMGWLYFLLMSGIAILLGAFGSVFNTYSALYLSKDNDLLLSLPIPIRTIVAARVINVYLMGALYASTVLIPTLAVYWIEAGFTAARVICGILLFVIVTVIILMLSTLLGWVVARISLKLKNKSFITVLVALVFMVGYYFVYFKANAFIQNMALNASVYGEKIRGAALGLYLFGRIGEGHWLCAAGFTVASAILAAVIWIVLQRSFLRIATASGSPKKVRYAEKAVRRKSVFGALLVKELTRFTSSPNYMLNCGLSILLIPACGVLLLVKGQMFCEIIESTLSERPGSAAVLLCAAICAICSMNDMAAPSVSLEGKSLWIAQSLPVEPKTVLRAKAAMQLILTAVPVLFSAVCAAVAVDATTPVKCLLCVTPLIYTAFSALLNSWIGIRMPLLNWTNEIVPIKQSGAVMIALFGNWGVGIAFAGLYLLAGYLIGAAIYLLLWAVLLTAASLWLLKRLDTKGAAAFAAL